MHNTALKRKWDNQNILDYVVKAARDEGEKIGMEKGIAKGMEKGIAKGMEKGIAKGKNEQNRKVANALNSSGMSITDISRILGLSELKVTSLLNEE